MFLGLLLLGLSRLPFYALAWPGAIIFPSVSDLKVVRRTESGCVDALDTEYEPHVVNEARDVFEAVDTRIAYFSDSASSLLHNFQEASHNGDTAGTWNNSFKLG